MKLGEIIKREREARGMAKMRLAYKADIALNNIQVIENGKNPNPKLSTLNKIAKVFGTTVSELLKDYEE